MKNQENIIYDTLLFCLIGNKFSQKLSIWMIFRIAWKEEEADVCALYYIYTLNAQINSL